MDWREYVSDIKNKPILKPQEFRKIRAQEEADKMLSSSRIEEEDV